VPRRRPGSQDDHRDDAAPVPETLGRSWANAGRSSYRIATAPSSDDEASRAWRRRAVKPGPHHCHDRGAVAPWPSA
jgi:hypothetical protein